MARTRPARDGAVRAILLAATVAAAPAWAQDVCGRGGAPCTVEGGSYHAVLPDAPSGGAVVLLHGFGGSGDGMLGATGVVDAITARGYAVIAPNGLPFAEGDTRGSWSFLPDEIRPRRRDEGAFLAAVVQDASDRYGVDPDRTLLAGFSAGGFLVNYLACETPDAFPAYAPVSGGFWRPHPDACAGPVRLLHTHGFQDSTVPLEGRPLRGGQFIQGDIFEGLGIWRDANGCEWDDPDAYAVTGPFQRRRWDCAPGAALEFALFDGGHTIPDGWADMALDWFEDGPLPAVTD